MNWLALFDERQKKEIEFAKLYAQQFKHGTDGHNAKIIIARLTTIIETMIDALEQYHEMDAEEIQYLWESMR